MSRGCMKVPQALKVYPALHVPSVRYPLYVGFLLRGFVNTCTTKYIRVKNSQGTPVVTDGSLVIDTNGLISSPTGTLTAGVTVSVQNFTFTGMTGKSPCVYVNWCDAAGTVIGQRVPVAATAVTGSASVTASASVSNPSNASFFFLTFDENVAQGAATPESFAVPLNASIGELAVGKN